MQVTDHARQLMEKHLGKPFFDGGYAGSVARMTADDLQEGLAWVDDRFFPIRYEDEALPSVEWVLNVAKAAVLRCCFHCTVLHRQTSFFLLVGMPMLAHFTVLRCSQHQVISCWYTSDCNAQEAAVLWRKAFLEIQEKYAGVASTTLLFLNKTLNTNSLYAVVLHIVTQVSAPVTCLWTAVVTEHPLQLVCV